MISVDPIDHGLVVDPKQPSDAAKVETVHLHLDRLLTQTVRVPLLLRGNVVGFATGDTAHQGRTRNRVTILDLPVGTVAKRTGRRTGRTGDC